MYACLYKNTCTLAHWPQPHIYVHMYIYTHTHTHIYIYTCVYIYMLYMVVRCLPHGPNPHIYICIYIHIPKYFRTFVSTNIYVCGCVCAFASVSAHVCVRLRVNFKYAKVYWQLEYSFSIKSFIFLARSFACVLSLTHMHWLIHSLPHVISFSSAPPLPPSPTPHLPFFRSLSHFLFSCYFQHENSSRFILSHVIVCVIVCVCCHKGLRDGSVTRMSWGWARQRLHAHTPLKNVGWLKRHSHRAGEAVQDVQKGQENSERRG